MELYEAEYHKAAQELLDPSSTADAPFGRNSSAFGRNSPSVGGAYSGRPLGPPHKMISTATTDGGNSEKLLEPVVAGIEGGSGGSSLPSLLRSSSPRNKFIEPRLKPPSFRSALLGSKPVCSGNSLGGSPRLAQRRSLSPSLARMTAVEKEYLANSSQSEDDEQVICYFLLCS